MKMSHLNNHNIYKMNKQKMKLKENVGGEDERNEESIYVYIYFSIQTVREIETERKIN